MNCSVIHKKMIFYLEGDLRKEEMEEIGNHMKNCSECAAFSEELKKTLGIITVEKEAAVNPFFYTRVKAKLEAGSSIPQYATLKPAYIRILQPVFFSILLAVGVFTGIKIGHAPSRYEAHRIITEEGLVPFLDDLSDEPLETFLFDQDGNE